MPFSLEMDASAFEDACQDEMDISLKVPKGMTVMEIADALDHTSLWAHALKALGISDDDGTRIMMKLNTMKRAAESPKKGPKSAKKNRPSPTSGASWADSLRASSPNPKKPIDGASASNFLEEAARKQKHLGKWWSVTVVKPEQRNGSNAFWHWNATNVETIRSWLKCTGQDDFQGSTESTKWSFKLSSEVVQWLNGMGVDTNPTSNPFVQFNKFVKKMRGGDADKQREQRQLAGDPASFKTVEEVTKAEDMVIANSKIKNDLKMAAAGSLVDEHLAAMLIAETDAQSAAMEKWKAAKIAQDAITSEISAETDAINEKFGSIRIALLARLHAASSVVAAEVAAAKMRDAPPAALAQAREQSMAARTTPEAEGALAAEEAQPSTIQAGGGIMGLLLSSTSTKK